MAETFTAIALRATRRGGFKTSEMSGDTWLVTKQDDVVSTDIRSGFSAMVQPDDLVGTLNGARDAAWFLNELKDSIDNGQKKFTAQELLHLMAEYNL